MTRKKPIKPARKSSLKMKDLAPRKIAKGGATNHPQLPSAKKPSKLMEEEGIFY